MSRVLQQNTVLAALAAGADPDRFLGNAVRIAGFAQRGFEVAQSGSWLGKCHFAFFESKAATTTCFETYAFDADWEYPEPDAWYP
jgi:hypothetical protein